MEIKGLDKIFNPQSIAVIGASNDKDSVGYGIFKNLKDYNGEIYPVNIKRKIIQGKKAYKKISEIKEKIDLAIIATPAPNVPSLVEECGKKGVSTVVIITAGFKEIGQKG